MVVGITVRLEAVMAIKVHMASEAVSLSRFSACSCPHGLKSQGECRRCLGPECWRSWLPAGHPWRDARLGTLGKRRRARGPRRRASARVSPPSCAILITPDQKETIPIRPAATTTACSLPLSTPR